MRVYKQRVTRDVTFSENATRRRFRHDYVERENTWTDWEVNAPRLNKSGLMQGAGRLFSLETRLRARPRLLPAFAGNRFPSRHEIPMSRVRPSVRFHPSDGISANSSSE
jgi:hypothetical protein